jgi:excisionase family DNA binding protein
MKNTEDKNENNSQIPQMMTISEVAEILKISEKTVSRMLQEGSIPGFKVANQWRFYRDDFYKWIDHKRGEWGNRARAGLASMLSNEIESVPVSRLTNEKLIVTNIPDASKKSVLTMLTQPLVDNNIVNNASQFVDGLMAREELMSTGVGGGIAIPHLRNPEMVKPEKPLLVIGISKKGVDWDSFDSEPVKIFMLPLSGDEVVHLKMLAAIRRFLILDGVIEILTSAETPEDVMKEIVKIETIQQSFEG